MSWVWKSFTLIERPTWAIDIDFDAKDWTVGLSFDLDGWLWVHPLPMLSVCWRREENPEDYDQRCGLVSHEEVRRRTLARFPLEAIEQARSDILAAQGGDGL